MPRVARQQFPNYSKRAANVSKFFADLPTLVGNVALNFYQDSWRRGGFIDSRIEKWPARKKSDKKARRLLVQSGRLRRSLRMTTNGLKVKIFTDVPYAEIHNEGGEIKGTQRVRSHVRKTPTGKTTKVRSHARTMNVQIPKRQFMGHSKVLDKRIELLVERALKQMM